MKLSLHLIILVVGFHESNKFVGFLMLATKCLIILVYSLVIRRGALLHWKFDSLILYTECSKND